MNHYEYNRELKRMDLHEILIHLIYICVHVEQNRHLLFLSWLIWRRGTQQSFPSIGKFEGHYKECLHPHGTA
jgi:hypothetical protein